MAGLTPQRRPLSLIAALRQLVRRVTQLVLRALRWPSGPINRIPHVVQVGRRADLPRHLDRRLLYVVGAAGTPPKWAVMRCPCGTGHQIDLNLGHAGQDRWSVDLGTDGGPSLRPSIDVRAERRCHFWLTDGEVRWCANSDGFPPS